MASDPLPDGWHEDLLNRADLEHSFAALEGRKHFFAEAWRGRLRSYELRFNEAWDHFDRANDLALEAPSETIPNLIAQFQLHVWCLENALAQAPLVLGEQFKAESNLPEIPEFILKEYPEVRHVLRTRRFAEGMLRLHMGEHVAAVEVFEELATEDLEGPPEVLAFDALCLAAALYNADRRGEALLELRKAGIGAQTTTRVLQRGLLGAIIVAFQECLRDGAAASWWRGFVEGQECPERTREVFLRRAELLLERCRADGRLLLF